MKPTLIGLSTTEIQTILKNLSEPAFRGKQISDWIYKCGIRDFDSMTNLSKELRNKLQDKYVISHNSIVKEQHSQTGTIKYLVQLKDYEKIECVKIMHKDHQTCCLSTQVGCPLACSFCATGLSGYKRNLDCNEIVDQYLLTRLASGENAPRISNIVFMGMGEPLLNLDEVLKSVDILNNEIGIGIRNITISSIGVIDGIKKLLKKNLDLNLAISLHAPNQRIRAKLIPYSTKYKYFELLDACKEYTKVTKRRITFEYVMLKGVNDSLDDARELITKLYGIHCHVNLIPFNNVKDSVYNPSSQRQVLLFEDVLRKSGFPTTIRKSEGQDIDAACGQLRNSNT